MILIDAEKRPCLACDKVDCERDCTAFCEWLWKPAFKPAYDIEVVAMELQEQIDELTWYGYNYNEVLTPGAKSEDEAYVKFTDVQKLVDVVRGETNEID